MKDEYGQKLAHDVTLPFDTDDEWPEVQVGMSGSVFEAVKGKARSVPIGSVNVNAYSMASAAPDEAQLARFVAREQDRKEDTMKIVSKLAHGKTEVIHPSAAKNSQFVKSLDLDAQLAHESGHGAVVFAVQQFNRYGESTPPTCMSSASPISRSALN